MDPKVFIAILAVVLMGFIVMLARRGAPGRKGDGTGYAPGPWDGGAGSDSVHHPDGNHGGHGDHGDHGGADGGSDGGGDGGGGGD